MYSSHLSATITIMVCWILFGFCFVGVGLLIRRLLRLESIDVIGLFLAFWSGWSAVIAILQIWHLVLPVNGLALRAIGLLGLLGLMLYAQPLRQLASLALKRTPTLILVSALLMLWMANRSTGPLQHYDTQMYYYPTMSWLMSFPIVPGLANLYTILGYNSSYFLYTTLTNLGPLSGKAHHISDGLLLYILLSQGLVSITLITLQKKKPWHYLFWSMLCIAPALRYIFGLDFDNILPYLPVNGSSLNTGSFVLTFIIMGLMIVLIFDYDQLSPIERSAWRFILILIIYIIVTIRISMIVFAITAITIVYVHELIYKRSPKNHHGVPWISMFAPLVGLGLLVVGIWSIRSIILSGYVAYPSTFGAIPVPWRVPKVLVIDQTNWVKSWARMPSPHWATVLDNSAWMEQWFKNMPSINTQPVWLAILGLLIILLIIPFRSKISRAEWLVGVALMIPPLATICFVFITAPNLGFYAGGSLWSLGLLMVFLVTKWLTIEVTPKYLQFIQLTVVFSLILYSQPFRNPIILTTDSSKSPSLPPVPIPSYTSYTTSSGLQVFRPTTGDQCGLAPIPCTPYPFPGLRLREPGNLSAGFILDRPYRYFEPLVGVTVPESLGVSLPYGWYPWEAEYNLRWMADEGAILVFTEQPQSVQMTVQSASMHAGNGSFGQEGRLSVIVNGKVIDTLDVQSGQLSNTKIQLHSGFTKIVLRLEAGSFVPSENIPNYNDTRTLSFAASSIIFSVDP